MENLPESLYDEPMASYFSGGGPGHGPFYSDVEPKSLSVAALILSLNDALFRETALDLLCKITMEFTNLNADFVSEKRDTCEEIAVLLWNSFGTISTLLKEIVDVYKLLSTPDLESHSNRVCNALALLQCVASHPDTRMLFVRARIPLYLYPLLNTKMQDKPHEYLRLTSLGVIGSLLKSDDKEVAYFLIETEVFPFCIRCMYVGNQLSKAVAALIVHKILMHDVGLRYCCGFAERFYAICGALNTMVETQNTPSANLLKHVICCYLRLSESPRARETLKKILPQKLRDPAVISILQDEPTAKLWLQNLLLNTAVGFR